MKASDLIKQLQQQIDEVGDMEIQVDTASNDDWMDVTGVFYEAGYIVLHAFDLRAGE